MTMYRPNPALTGSCHSSIHLPTHYQNPLLPEPRVKGCAPFTFSSQVNHTVTDEGEKNTVSTSEG